MKKFVTYLLLLMMIITISGCDNNDNHQEQALKFKEEYESLNGKDSNGKTIRTVNIKKDNPFIYKDAGDIIKMINNKESFIVYFGFAKCPWCRSMIEALITVANDYEVDTIYYVDILEIRDVLKLDDNNEIITEKEGSKDYMKLIKLLDNVLSDYDLKDASGNSIETGEKRIYAPNVVAIVKGKATLLTEGLSDDQDDPYQKLTEDILDEEYEKISKIMEELKEKNTCSTDSKC